MAEAEGAEPLMTGEQVRAMMEATEAPFTFDAFVSMFYALCKEAWDDGRQRVAVTLRRQAHARAANPVQIR